MRVKPLLALAVLAAAAQAQAAIVITEVAPWSSGNSSVGADWFEITNTGTSAVSLSGWKMDDNSNSFAVSAPMSGVSSLAAGESAIFLEVSAALPAATAIANFRTVWGVPASLQIGSYIGSGVGLSTAGDAVNVYDAAGALQANVAFGASPLAAPFATFDNAALLSNVTLTNLSATGVNGAITVNDVVLGVSTALIGSPGSVGNSVAAVPAPDSVATLGLGLAMLGGFLKRSRASRRNA